MPAVTADTAALPRLPHLGPETEFRPVAKIVTCEQTARRRRVFPSGARSPASRSTWPTRSFCSTTWAARRCWRRGEAKGTPVAPAPRLRNRDLTWSTGGMRHQDTHGGGGVISGGDTQWMTAGSGIQHIEQPVEAIIDSGGVMHGVQLWGEPAGERRSSSHSAYQDLKGGQTGLVASEDGGRAGADHRRRVGRSGGPGFDVHPDHLHARHLDAGLAAGTAVAGGVQRVGLCAERQRRGRRGQPAPGRRGNWRCTDPARHSRYRRIPPSRRQPPGAGTCSSSAVSQSGSRSPATDRS